MLFAKLETLGSLGVDFIIKSDAYIEHIKEDYIKTNNKIFELDVITSAIQNANKQSGIENIYKLTIDTKSCYASKNCVSKEYILINLPLDTKINDGLFLYKHNTMFNQMDGTTTLNRTFVFKPNGQIYIHQSGETDNIQEVLSEINRKVKSEFKYLYYLFHEGKIEFAMN